VRGLQCLSTISVANGESSLAVQYASEIIELEPLPECFEHGRQFLATCVHSRVPFVITVLGSSWVSRVSRCVKSSTAAPAYSQNRPKTTGSIRLHDARPRKI
jgi:hypothetical protein